LLMKGIGISLTTKWSYVVSKLLEHAGLVVVRTVTSWPAADHHLAQLYGRREAIEFWGGKKVVTIKIFIF
jgi:hypothetical protein